MVTNWSPLRRFAFYFSMGLHPLLTSDALSVLSLFPFLLIKNYLAKNSRMNIIQVLKTEVPQYKKVCFEALKTHIDVIEMNYSGGETDLTTLLFLKKENLIPNEAWAILTLRLFMHSEEFDDFESYTTEEVLSWMELLATQYNKTTFELYTDTAIHSDNYFIDRLKFPEKTNVVRYNGRTISPDTFDKIDPLSDTLRIISRTKFNTLEAEFYIETEKHYLLLNWFTTA